MGGLTFEKLAIVLVIALIILGPDRLPFYAQKLGELVKSVKRMADGAKERVKDEMGDEFDEVDWKQLDPRQYDPRRIIRDALVEEGQSPEARRARAIAASRSKREARQLRAQAEVAAAAAATVTVATIPASFNYDDEAT